MISAAHTFFVLEVFDGRGKYSFGLGLTDQAVARSMLEAFGCGLLGRVSKLVSFEDIPECYGERDRHDRHTEAIRLLFKRCVIEPNPARAFLVAYVEAFKTVMPISQMAEMLTHAKYEPDFGEHVFVPIHEAAIGRPH